MALPREYGYRLVEATVEIVKAQPLPHRPSLDAGFTLNGAPPYVQMTYDEYITSVYEALEKITTRAILGDR